jgi:agmatinase
MQTEFQHEYSGPVSFYRSPEIPIDALPAGSVAVLGVPIDAIIVARNGQRYAPRSIREQSLKLAAYYGIQIEPGYVDIGTGEIVTIPESPRIFDVGDVPIIQQDLRAQTEVIIQCAADIVARDSFPVLLGGDHYVAYPGLEGFVRGVKLSKGDRRIGYLHIDSHLDFFDEYKGMGRFHHGTCTRRISENPAVKNMVWFGLNGHLVTEPNQLEILLERRAIAYTTPGIRSRGPAAAMREALEIVSDGVDDVYISCDIDVVDGAYAPGTHSMVVAGLTSEEFLDAMGVVQEFDTVGALDVCETLPLYDTGGGRTSRIASLGILAALGRKFHDRRPGYTRDQIDKVFR